MTAAWRLLRYERKNTLDLLQNENIFWRDRFVLQIWGIVLNKQGVVIFYESRIMQHVTHYDTIVVYHGWPRLCFFKILKLIVQNHQYNLVVSILTSLLLCEYEFFALIKTSNKKKNSWIDEEMRTGMLVCAWLPHDLMQRVTVSILRVPTTGKHIELNFVNQFFLIHHCFLESVLQIKLD